jgi:hypothetical protein
MSGSPSSDPAGMKTMPECSMKRGILDPQVLQNVLGPVNTCQIAATGTHFVQCKEQRA